MLSCGNGFSSDMKTELEERGSLVCLFHKVSRFLVPVSGDLPFPFWILVGLAKASSHISEV